MTVRQVGGGGTQNAAVPCSRPDEAVDVRSETYVGTPTVSMPVRRLIAGTDIAVFPVALGGSVFGWTASADDTQTILDRYAAAGGNFIDTADSYASGLSEVQIGRWMKLNRNRDAMVVATKIGRHADYAGLARSTIMAAVDASLERLGTDRIDVLYLHADDPATPLEETLGAARDLIQAGKVRALGASDFPVEKLVEARILAAAGYPKLTAFETEYSLANRSDFEGDRSVVATGQGLAVMPYFALASGFLTGKYRSRADFTETTRGSRAAAHFTRRGSRILRALDSVAAAHGVGPATIALAWLLTRRPVCAPVVSASEPDQVDALVAAPRIALSRSQLLELDRSSRA
ncbi:aldo/keto reductase [Paramicrobacterium agarici]|uniref:Aryl-alcohol dehydrogenase-like predicted oxidoreductase n=1 Tax=Paramicrobacterium agarici TaxID=630514 RepID=A0A2A9DYL5_9MICO|nr:aldo/keto reductase [Microbacterium agarici]PFG31029.1 aryl-alcohol dehydrogenase-like predicted oxidoreductase [Microbacterium agarici]TQO24093.1 aryl-alcohol dehydrogenase-like predicted oxidoreductase [Microbacterium agarici]